MSKIKASLRQMLDLSIANGFLNESNQVLTFGPLGALLQENARREWLQTMIVNRDFNVYLNTNETMGNLPKLITTNGTHGIAEIKDLKSEINVFDNYKFSPITKLACKIFVPETNSMQFFHSFQRQRKMWWRKFSATPNRYNITEVKTEEDKSNSVQLTAEFPWGVNLLEEIRLQKTKPNLNCISSETNLQMIALNMLCDSYDETRNIFRLHTKLAPYKLTLAINYTDSSLEDDLLELARYLSKVARNANISTITCSNCVYELSPKKAMEISKFFTSVDQIGVPYSIVLRDTTVRNGICGLRSRDTTIEEEIHITDIPRYLHDLLNVT